MKEKDDFEIIDNDTSTGEKPDDLGSAIMGFLSGMNYKLLFFLFLIFIFLTSDIFVEKILARINGAVNGHEISTKGTLIQGLLLVLMYSITDLIIQLNYL
jgi:hypothetical protein